MTKKTKILEYLDVVAQILPAPIYWLDKNSAVLGINKQMLEAVGVPSYEFAIGKTAYDVYPLEIARTIIVHNEAVMASGKIMSQEESIIDITTGKTKYFTAVKAPLFDENGEVIGLIGTSIEITDRKEKERLEIEHERDKTLIQEQEKFRKRADQVAHDINSPLSSLKMLAEVYTDMPEEYRLILRKANDRIQDIANDLLRDYKPPKNDLKIENDSPQPTLVSALLFEILSEKRAQYAKLDIQFNHRFTADASFAFIQINRVAFARSISSIINNSVDAFKDKNDKQVTLYLDTTESSIQLVVRDNGKGMSQNVIDKILNNIPITEGKEHGHGIGYTQIRETIANAQGNLAIESQLNIGTSIILTFPKIKTPDWAVNEITLGPNDIIIVLDDDDSIHDAWDARFNHILKTAPDIQVKHFTQGQDSLNFIKRLSDEAKQRVFLLADYELLKQELNGLQIIKLAQLKRAVLVTSHYLNNDLRIAATNIGIKILAKQLASVVPIKIVSTSINDTDTLHSIQNSTPHNLKNVDLIILDDDKMFVNSCIQFLFKDMNIDSYFIPEDLLNNIAQYSKDTKIVLDNNYNNSNLTGIELAQILHNMGFTNLYIISGEKIENTACITYATPILKTNLSEIKKLLGK